MSVGVLDVFENLPSERALAQRLEPFLQLVEVALVGEAREALLKALLIAEGKVVDDADEAIKLQ